MDKHGGTLEITLSRLELSKEFLQSESTMTPGQYVKLTVADNGPGIETEDIDRIFDPYFTTKEIGKGSGMGLAVVHGIIKNHGGMIKVKNNPSGGAIFMVFFPAVKDRVEEKNETGGPLPLGTERILVVDDEFSVVEVTKWRLERLGYNVVAKTDSVAALELLRSQPNAFDLIITDQTMPLMTGDQLAKEIKQINPNIPVIICTGYSSKMNNKSNALEGVCAFIMKPVEYYKLAKIVRQLLDA